MHFATHDGREGRAASRLRALVGHATPGPSLLTWYELSERPDGIRVSQSRSDDDMVLPDFEEASEALLQFVARHSYCSLLAYRSPLRARGQDDMQSAVVWPAGQWPRIKLLM